MFSKILLLLFLGLTIAQQCVRRPSSTTAPTTTHSTTRASTTTKTTMSSTTIKKGCLLLGSLCNATSDCCRYNDATFRFLPICAEDIDGNRICVCNFVNGCFINEPCCNGLPCNHTLALCPQGFANDFCSLGMDSCVAPFKMCCRSRCNSSWRRILCG